MQIPERNQETIKFLSTVFTNSKGYITVSEFKTKKTAYFSTSEIEKAAAFSLELSKDRDVYFGCSTRIEKLDVFQRGTYKDVCAINMIWLEIDLMDGIHKNINLPDQEEAGIILNTFPLEPTIMVHSGGGYHLYWMLDEPFLINNEVDREFVSNLISDFQHTFIDIARQMDLHIDNTSDITRVLRVPNTLNHKSKQTRLVSIIDENSEKYTIPEIEDAIKDIQEKLPPKESDPQRNFKIIRGAKSLLPDSNVEPIVEGCHFIQNYLKTKESASYAEWMTALSIGSHCNDFEEICHEWSQGHPSYSQKETDKKMKEIRSKMKPRTCQTIDREFGSCSGCEHKGKIKSPIVLGMKSNVIDITEDEDFEPKLIPQGNEFPVEVFPTTLQQYLRKMSDAVQVAPDFLGLSMLTVLSTLIGKQAKIKITNEWSEACVLYSAFIGEPGTRKTPSLKKAMEPIREIQKELNQKFEEQLQLYQYEKTRYEQQLQDWKKTPKKDRDSDDYPREPIEPASQPIVAINDSTIESIVDLSQTNSLLLEKDELAGWITGMNQYKGGGGNEKQQFLELWNCNQITVTRKGSKPMVSENPFVSIIGGIQPDRLSVLMEDQAQDGFLDRILFAFPNEVPEIKLKNVIVDHYLKQTYINAGKKLYSNLTGENEGQILVELNEEAEDIFTQYYDGIYETLGNPYFDSRFRGVWIKLSSYFARFTLILHLTHWSVGSEWAEDKMIVQKEVVEKAITLIEYFKSMATKTYTFIQPDQEEKSCLALVQWMKKHNLTEVSARDVRTAKVAGANNAHKAKELLIGAYNNGYGKIEEVITKNKQQRLIFKLHTQEIDPSN